ncbi:hypothetical protein B0T10DRAFT_313501 [Thelonectria olida]|uniref:C2H2-type domain-containing protein n=1 Tax=Thelonectria olida TaxID=1576542 RepID=A0A9P8W7W6_9HYPO|nr:hypothetical protein B0T10DRAFT_313501 [Thelonectria olida]
MAAFIIPLLSKRLQSDAHGEAEIVPATEPRQFSNLQGKRACVACKERYVKSDRTKPHCKNCLHGRAKSRARSVQLHGHSRQIARRSPPRIQPQVDTVSMDFPDAASALYFEEFVSLVQGPWITAVSSGNLWGVILPQLTRNAVPLRNAAMAIGALSIWHRQSNCDSLSLVSIPAQPTSEEDTHYFRAVHYYCRSLKLQSQSSSAHEAVFLSVLLLFFERLRGNKKAALDHVNHGLALLFAILAEGDPRGHVSKFGPNPKPVLGALADTFIYLTTQIRTVLRGRVGDGPSLPNFFKGLQNKKQTIESFMVIVSQLPQSSATVDRIPAVFSRLDEFEEYWTTIVRQQIGMGPIMMEILRASNASKSNDEGAISKFYGLLVENGQIKEFCDDNRRKMEALDAAFSPLFNRLTMSETESPEYLKAIHLRLQYLITIVFQDPGQFFDVEVLHSRTHLYREYLALAQTALRTARREIKNPAHQLSLQCGLSWYLLTTALFCRDPLVRDEAVSMLKDYPGQDGLWSSRSLYYLALRNRAVERMNAAEGTPMEQWQRLWRRDFVFEEGGDCILFRYLEKDEATGKWELVEETAKVPGKSEDIDWKRQPLTGSGGMLMGDLHSDYMS